MASDLQSLRHQVADKIAALEQAMTQLGLTTRIEGTHEFTPHTPASLQLVRETASALKQLPKNDANYCQSAILVASALASIGDWKGAEGFLDEARKKAKGADRPLVYYNLFQARVRRGAFDDAIDGLTSALRADPKGYGLHDTKKYPPQKVLGAGGMGALFQCENPKGGKPVAVKTLWDPNVGAGDAIFSDVERLKQVANDSILVPIDYGFTDDKKKTRPYFVSERVLGTMDGDAWLAKHGPLSLQMGQLVGTRILEALAAAHAAGVCHLDLKPSNVLFRRLGANDVEVTITDFGLARAGRSLRNAAAVHQGNGTSSALAEKVMSTVEYAPPEQRGRADHYGAPGPLSDIYSFAATMYKLMTGDSPNPKAISREKLAEIPGLFELVEMCLQNDPKRRPQSVGAFLPLWQNPQIHLDNLAAAAEAKRLADEKARHEAALLAAEEAHGKKTKPLLIGGIAGGVVVVVAVVVIILSLGGDDKKGPGKGGSDGGGASGYSVAEYREMESWYKAARKLIADYLVGLCRPVHDAGNQMWSYIVKEKGNFKLTLRPAEGQSAKGKFDVLACPSILADIQKKHAVQLKMNIRYQKGRTAFDKGKHLCTVKITSKNTGYLKKSYYVGGAKPSKKAFYCGGFGATGDSGFRRLAWARPAVPDREGLKLANLRWERPKKVRRKPIHGTYTITLTSDRMKEITSFWKTCPTAFLPDFKKVRPPTGSKQDYAALWEQGQEWAKGFCDALVMMHQSFEPYDDGKAQKAKAKLKKLKETWNNEILGKVNATAAKVKLQHKGEPF